MITTYAFSLWYEAHFKKTDLYRKMGETNEGSPWHREANVGLHTDMVLNEYLSNFTFLMYHGEMLGALAAVFHDVGKPGAMEVIWKPERGSYKRFGGHEVLSARLWEDYAVSNWDHLKLWFGLKPHDIYTVALMIEHHLPWAMTDKVKLTHLAKTIVKTVGFKVFKNFLMADQLGRISDDQDQKIAKVNEWLGKFGSIVNSVDDLRIILDNATRRNKVLYNDSKTLIVLIGASGSGKTSFMNKLIVGPIPPIDYFSLDDLRVKMYNCDYDEAIRKSFADKDFNNKAQKAFGEVIKRDNRKIVVDGVNLIKKRRRMYIDMARRAGYNAVAVIFPVALQTIIDRQQTRPDKSVKAVYVQGQYNILQLPQFGEFDEVLVSTTNLPS